MKVVLKKDFSNLQEVIKTMADADVFEPYFNISIESISGSGCFIHNKASAEEVLTFINTAFNAGKSIGYNEGYMDS